MHDSEDWKGVISAISSLRSDVRHIETVQNQRHENNQERFKDLECELKEVKSEVEKLKDIIQEAKGVLEGLRTAAHALKWTVAIVGGILAILMGVNTLFGPIIRTHFGLPNSKSDPHPTTLSEAPHQQLNAHDE